MALGARGLKVPQFLLCTFFTLSILNQLMSWVFKAMGFFAYFMDADYSATGLQPHSPPEQAQSAELVRKMLPVFKFNELMVSKVDGYGVEDGCAVCLCEFEGDDEIRPLTNCRHIFHRSCLDGWIDHDHRTCPLCRTPMVSMDREQNSSTLV